MHARIRTGLVALVAVISTAAFAQDQKKQAGTLQPPRSAQELLQKLHATNQKELELGQLALEQAQSQQTRQVAQQILQDHRQLEQRLSQTAQQMNVQLKKPKADNKMEKQLQTFHKNFKETLKATRGELFDPMYLSGMVMGHATDIQMLQAAQQSLGDQQQASQLITQTLPILQRHQQLAYQALGQVTNAQGVGGAGMQPEPIPERIEDPTPQQEPLLWDPSEQEQPQPQPQQ